MNMLDVYATMPVSSIGQLWATLMSTSPPTAASKGKAFSTFNILIQKIVADPTLANMQVLYNLATTYQTTYFSENIFLDPEGMEAVNRDTRDYVACVYTALRNITTTPLITFNFAEVYDLTRSIPLVRYLETLKATAMNTAQSGNATGGNGGSAPTTSLSATGVLYSSSVDPSIKTVAQGLDEIFDDLTNVSFTDTISPVASETVPMGTEILQYTVSMLLDDGFDTIPPQGSQPSTPTTHTATLQETLNNLTVAMANALSSVASQLLGVVTSTETEIIDSIQTAYANIDKLNTAVTTIKNQIATLNNEVYTLQNEPKVPTMYARMVGFCTTPPDIDEVVSIFVADTTMTYPENFVGSVGAAGDPPANAYVFTIQKNGTAIGTVTANPDKTFTFAGTAGTLNTGDVVQIVGAANPDSSLADVALTLVFTIPAPETTSSVLKLMEVPSEKKEVTDASSDE